MIKQVSRKKLFSTRKIRIRKLDPSGHTEIVRNANETFSIVRQSLTQGMLVYAQPLNKLIRDETTFKAKLEDIDTLTIIPPVGGG